MRSPNVRRYIWHAAAVGVVITALAGCGSSSNGATTSIVGAAVPAINAGPALRLWDRFPANASPRPVVTSGGLVSAPNGGFTSGDAKLAFMEGNLRLAAPLPTAPTHADGFAIISPAQAVARAASSGSSQPGLKTRASPLLITKVQLGTAPFQTDRGFRRLPVWQLYFQGNPDPASVLALTDGEIFTPPHPLRRRTATVPVGSAAASPDGTRITVSFTGGHAGNKPCDDNYTAAVATSSHAVAVSVIDHPVKADANCLLPGFRRRVTVRLDRPLGGRALINSGSGSVIPVVIGSANPGTATQP